MRPRQHSGAVANLEHPDSAQLLQARYSLRQPWHEAEPTRHQHVQAVQRKPQLMHITTADMAHSCFGMFVPTIALCHLAYNRHTRTHVIVTFVFDHRELACQIYNVVDQFLRSDADSALSMV